MSQTWLLFGTEEGGSLKVVSKCIFMLWFQVSSKYWDCWEGMMGIWHASCVILLVGRRSWSNCCRSRQPRATTITMNFGNGRGRFDTSAWCSTSKLPHLVNVRPVTIAYTIRSRGSASDVLQCTNFKVEENACMKTRLVVQRPAVKLWTQLVILGGCICCTCRCNVQLPLEMEAREEYKGPHLLSKWSGCED